MANIKLRGTLPEGEANGLRDVADEFVDDPDGLKIAVVLLDTKATIEDRDKGEVTAQARVRRVELVSLKDDVKALRRIMLRANEERTGKTVLPLDLEESIDDVFANFTAGGLDPKPDQED